MTQQEREDKIRQTVTWVVLTFILIIAVSITVGTISGHRMMERAGVEYKPDD